MKIIRTSSQIEITIWPGFYLLVIASGGGAAIAAAPGKTKVVEKVVVDETAISAEKERLRLVCMSFERNFLMSALSTGWWAMDALYHEDENVLVYVMNFVSILFHVV